MKRNSVESIIERLQPALAMHGGSLEIMDIDTKRKRVVIRFEGTCSHCAISEITLKHLIEAQLRSLWHANATVVAE